MGIADERTVSLVTFRRTGVPVATPVWINAVSDGRVGFWTALGSGKTKRIAHTPRVTVQASNVRGVPKPGSAVIEGTAELVRSGPLFDEVKAAGKRKYGFQATLARLMGTRMNRRHGLAYGDCVVLIRLDG